MFVETPRTYELNAVFHVYEPAKQGPVVQSIISLTSSLRGQFVKCFKTLLPTKMPGCVAQSVGHLTRKSEVLGSIPGQAPYFRFSFRFFKKGSCQLLAKVCARSTG